MVSVDSTNLSKNYITFMSLKDPKFITLLKEFKSLLKSTVGPNGNCMLLVSGGGYVQLSSSSSQIVQHYDQFGSPIIQFIAQIMKGQTDFGLYCGIIISSCLERLLSLQSSNKITSKQCIRFLNFVINCCDQTFASDKLKIRINFDSLTEFIPVVKSVLKSKCKKLLMNDVIIAELSFQIIKVFLFTLDDELLKLGKVSVQVFKGDDKFNFYPGVIYQLNDSDCLLSNLVLHKFKNKTGIKTLLFTTMMDCEDSVTNAKCSNDNKLSDALRIFDEAVKLDVKIVACQKVVHNEITLFLRRKSVIILERMGTELALNFEQLTDSFPISCLDKLCITDLPQMTGVIDKLSTIEIGSNHYLLVERHSTSVATLILQTSCLSSTEQIKVLVEQALITLKTLIKHPYVCPGAGCLETCLWANIQALDEKNVSKDFPWLLNVLIEASGYSLPIWVDSLYKHAWSTEVQLKCNCQLLSRDMILKNGGSYKLFSLSNDSLDFNFHLSDNLLVKTLSESAIIDSYILKRNSIMSSLESCINLLGIGAVVCTKK